MAKAKPLTPPADGDAPTGIDPFDLSAAPASSADNPGDRIDLTSRNVPAPDEIAVMRQQMNLLQQQVAALTTLLNRNNVSATVTTDDDEKVAKAKKIYQDTIAAVSKTTAERTQAVVDAQYPKKAGDKLFEIQLTDKPNFDPQKGTMRYEAGVFPKLVVPASDQASARGRYQDVCGIISTGDAPLVVKELAV